MIDYLIAGHGIAGAVFAWTAIRAGKSVLVVDREEANTSSRVAAGIVNPLTGRRLAKSWRFDDCRLPLSEICEREGWPFHAVPILRAIRDEDQSEKWAKRREDESARHLWQPAESPIRDLGHGAFQTRESGWMHLPRMLDLSRDELRKLGSYETGEVDIDQLPCEARHVIWCTGHHADPFKFVPLRPAKGEILTLRIPDLEESRILNWGNWLLPIGDGLYRAGSTFEWEDIHSGPTETGRVEIEASLRRIIDLPYEVVDHQAGIRPMSQQGRPIVGTHPDLPGHAIFNGLGSKGVLLAPFFAQQLLDHLETGAPIDPEADVRRFAKSTSG